MVRESQNTQAASHDKSYLNTKHSGQVSVIVSDSYKPSDLANFQLDELHVNLKKSLWLALKDAKTPP